MKHRLLVECPWASPEAIGRLTIADLHCLADAKAPDGRTALATADDFLRAVAAQREEDRAWTSDPKRAR